MTDKERTAWKALRTWFVDDQTSSAFVAQAIDYLLTEEPDKPEEPDNPEPLNAPPPDDMPCWVWDYPTERGQEVWLGCDVAECDHWQPCFVPLDAKPGSVWILWKEGPVSCENPGYQPDDDDRAYSRYIYTVPEVNP